MGIVTQTRDPVEREPVVLIQGGFCLTRCDDSTAENTSPSDQAGYAQLGFGDVVRAIEERLIGPRA